MANWLIVRAGGRDLAIDAARVERIVLAPPVTRVPGAALALRGLTAVHGRALPVLDLGERLGAAPLAPDARTPIVVVEGSAGAERVEVALLVEEAGRLAPAPALLPKPPLLEGFTDAALCAGFGDVDGTIVPVLDVDAVLEPGVRRDGAKGTMRADPSTTTTTTTSSTAIPPPTPTPTPTRTSVQCQTTMAGSDRWKPDRASSATRRPPPPRPRTSRCRRRRPSPARPPSSARSSTEA